MNPSLHEDYSTLCSSTVPVIKYMFGEDLQAALIHIKATNKIGAMVSSPSALGQASYQNTESRQGCYFFGRAPQFNRVPNCKHQN